MKKILLILFVTCSNAIISQSTGTPPLLTPDGIFDKVYDQAGSEYSLYELNRLATERYASSTINSVSSYSCSSGYFDLYFASGSCFDGTSAAATSKRNILCSVFSHVSGLIASAISSGTVRINMYCDDVPTSAGNTLGTASPFFVFAGSPTNPNQGIVHSQIQKVLLSGADPYANLPLSLFPGSASFYHGIVNARLNPPTGAWNYNLGTTSINSNEIDFYTVMLHEVLHAVGFGSLIGGTGTSFFGAANNYYSVYDKYLKDQAGNPLLGGMLTCPTSSLTYTASATAINPSNCSSGGIVVTTCSNACRYVSTLTDVAVFTPSCFVAGSSLSHFEDMCNWGTFTTTCVPSPFSPGNNNLYYLMSDALDYGSCYVKRHPVDEERYVLCDLGYSVNASFSSTVAGASYTYAGGACIGPVVYGLNDGLSGNTYLFSTTGASTNIPLSTLLANDSPSATVSCVEVIYSNSSNLATAVISGTDLAVSAAQGAGLILIKYLPLNSAGKYGNITYVYVYFLPNNCGTPDPCDLIQNKGFENTVGGAFCGDIVSVGGPTLNCWIPYLGTPDLYTRTCTSTFYDLGVNTQNTNPVVNSFNGSPNNRMVGLFCTSGSSITESMQNYLGAPLVAGNSYQLSLMAYNHSGPALGGTTIFNPSCDPMVLTIGSNATNAFIPQFPFPTGLNPLASFTVANCNVWTALTTTFVFNPSPYVNHVALVIGPEPAKITYTNPTSNFFIFIDEISLVPLPAPTFSLPSAIPCGNATYTNLAQYTSTFVGTFSGTGVTYTNSQYNFNSPPSLASGNYPIAFSYTNGNGCVSTNWQNVNIVSSLNLSTIGTATYCNNLNSSFSVSVSHTPALGGVSYTWQPGGFGGYTGTVNPTSSTIYTISATVGSCSGTSTLSVIVNTSCCFPTTITSYGSNSVSATASFTSPLVFNTSFTVGAGVSLELLRSYFLFARDVKVTVSNTATLSILGSHLYSCSNDLWKGIVVLDGGRVVAEEDPVNDVDNLVEDALVAIDVSSHSTSTLSNILTARNTIFNRNRISINISAYTRTLSTYPFVINNCIFTSRSISLTTPTVWPQAATSDLRSESVTNPTTGLAPPYLWQGYPVSNLKKPYQNQPSHTAININEVGVTTSTNMYGISIGSSNNADFNLFDSHGTFISAINSNVTVQNCVFQNTQRYLAPINPSIGIFVLTGGNAINDENYTMNSRLDLTAANTNLGARFWNCHTAIKTLNLLRFNMEKAIIRSTQTTATLTGQPGERGLLMQTNRFQYWIKDNEFTNINTCINIPISPDSYTCISSGSQYGIYADRIIVKDNSFAAGTPTTNYINYAVNISSPVNYSPTVANDFNIAPFTKGIVVEGNSLTKVYRGIYLNGVSGFQTSINNNTLSLAVDAVFSPPVQHGIDQSNSMSASNQAAQQIITTNTVTGASSNTTESLFFGSLNIGLFSPSITCNTATNSGQGFVFSGLNTPTITIKGTLWLGNKMGNLTRGMVLTTNGLIGQQGDGSQGINNQWVGSTWSTTNLCTWTYSSIALNSKLYLNGSSLPAYPQYNDGFPNANSYAGPGLFTTSLSADYSCTDPSARTSLSGGAVEYDSEELTYLARTGLYRFLYFNDSIKTSNGTLTDFYNGLAGSSIDLFIQAEKKLYQGLYEDARTIVAGITSVYQAEDNYKSFYSLLADYEEALAANDTLSSADSTALYELAQLCPEKSGFCVYQARALYNRIYSQILNFATCDDASEARPAKQAEVNTQVLTNQRSDYAVFPNPASDKLTVMGKNPEEFLELIVTDLSNRTILRTLVHTINFVANFPINFINGAYFLTIRNSSNEYFVQKLLIAK